MVHKWWKEIKQKCHINRKRKNLLFIKRQREERKRVRILSDGIFNSIGGQEKASFIHSISLALFRTRVKVFTRKKLLVLLADSIPYSWVLLSIHSPSFLHTHTYITHIISVSLCYMEYVLLFVSCLNEHISDYWMDSQDPSPSHILPEHC